MTKHLEMEISSEPAAGSLLDVDRAISDLRRGLMVVIRGEDGRPLLAQAAEAVTPQSLQRLATLSGVTPGLVLTAQRAAALGLGPIAANVITLELTGGIAAQTVRDIADPATAVAVKLPKQLGIEQDALRHSVEAAVELTKLARLLPAALTAPLEIGDGVELLEWAKAESLLLVDAGLIEDYELNASRSLRPVSQARVPLAGAEDARIVAYRPSDGGIEHLAIVIGEPKADAPVLVRLHSECFTGDLLASLRCDCGDQLRGAIEEISKAGSGILIYLAQEGRGIGLVNKLRAYRLQDAGFDTIDANQQLGFDADERIYLPAAHILEDLGFTTVRLLTNNPAKVEALARRGITVIERVPHVFPANDHNLRYLQTKATRGGHSF